MIRPLLPAVVVLCLALPPASCGKKPRGFRHDGHVTVVKGDCGACHGRDKGAPRPAAVADCAECHREAIAAGGARGNQYSAVKSGAVAPRQPGYADVAFPHRPHSDAGIPCVVCHPGPNVRTRYFPPMDACRDCHAKEGVRNDCPACHVSRRSAP